MSLRATRDYIRSRGTVTRQELLRELRLDEAVIDGHLDLLLARGVVERHDDAAPALSCASGGCSGCASSRPCAPVMGTGAYGAGAKMAMLPTITWYRFNDQGRDQP